MSHNANMPVSDQNEVAAELKRIVAKAVSALRGMYTVNKTSVKERARLYLKHATARDLDNYIDRLSESERIDFGITGPEGKKLK